MEASAVDRQSALPRHLLLLIERQPERVVKLERGGSGQHAAGRRTGFFREDFFGYLKRSRVPMLFFLHHAGHSRHALHHLGIAGLHQLRDEPGELVQVRILLPDHARVAHSPPHDFAQHVAAAFVGRRDAVVDQESGGPRVIRVDPQRYIVARVGAVNHAVPDQLGGAVDDGAEQVRFVVGDLALQHRSQAFQAQAGIDRRAGQGRHQAVGGPLELHEHQVPDFYETPAAIVREPFVLASRLGGFGAQLVVDLRARSARSGIAHLPEIILLVQAKNAVFGNARHPLP